MSVMRGRVTVHSSRTDVLSPSPCNPPVLQGYLKTVEEEPSDLAIPVRMKESPQDVFGNARDLYHFHEMYVRLLYHAFTRTILVVSVLVTHCCCMPMLSGSI